MAPQSPAEIHDTERSGADGFDAALAGGVASTPGAHPPALDSSTPCRWREVSLYCPTAPHALGEVHDTELRKAWGSDPASAGGIASIPVCHVPAVSLSSRPCVWPELSL